LNKILPAWNRSANNSVYS